MSQHQQLPHDLGRKQGGGSVKRAREMLNAGVRIEKSSGNQDSQAMPPPLRPRPPHRTESSRISPQEAEIEIGYQIEHDPRGPVPIMAIQGLPVPRHNGPPPTSRRGPSSVYLNATAVSPIPEETLQKSKKKKESYASSKVIPSSWGSGPPTSDILDSYASEHDEPKGPQRKRDSITLLRQASLGKRGKPSLRTINKPQPEKALLNEKYNKSSDSSLGYSTVNGLEPRASLDSVSSDSNDSLDLEKERIVVENEKKGRSIGMGLGLSRPGAGLSSKKPNSHRPPQLNMDAVRAAEAQGSLTSLPDLIRRATKVASNLERGRTASRLGFLDMFDMGKNQGGSSERKSASLSDILASFPPPRTGTPDNSVRNSWPFPFTNGGEKSRLREIQTNPADESGGTKKPGRRCCGMSLPLFIFVCVVVICVIAAAVVIPVVLVVLPRNKDHSSNANSANTTTTTATCEETLPCLNGGVSIHSETTCSCVCVDGFSGTQCGNASDGSCTTTETSESNNATVGSSIPVLFTESESNFNIYLNETEILSLFNANNVSCSVQNALVSFGGESSKRRRRGFPIEIQDVDIEPQATAAPVVKRKPDTTTAAYVLPILSVPTDTTSSTSAAETAGGAATVTAATTSATTSATTAATAATATTSSSMAASASVGAAVSQVYEFASVAVLYILEQTEEIDLAKEAQNDIDMFLLSQSISTSTNMSMSLSMPETFVLSFTNFTITLSNGTVVGGGNRTAT